MRKSKIQYWRNKKGEFNYRIVSRNGKVLASVNQGFKRKAGMLKNIHAVAAFFNEPFEMRVMI